MTILLKQRFPVVTLLIVKKSWFQKKPDIVKKFAFGCIRDLKY
jgi:hypothetical protein